jgi:hypothetical protein
MNVAEVSMILDRGLTAGEKTKFDRMKDRASAIFTAAGHTIRLCEATGEGERRKIGFVPGLFGAPLISLPSAEFLASPDEKLLQDLQRTLENAR